MSGRTTWFARDAAKHRRELVVELGEEHGAAVLAVLDVLDAWAQEQRSGGAVRGGFRTLARESFASVDECRRIVEHAARIGALDDLHVDADGRRFTLRVSGWAADQERGRTAWRVAAHREREAAGDSGGAVTDPSDTVTSNGSERPVTPAPQPNQTIDKEDVPLEHDQRLAVPLNVGQVFDAWVQSTGRDQARTKLTPERRRLILAALRSHGLDDCLAAVTNLGRDPFAMGQNDRHTPFNDVEHALKGARRIEKYRDWQGTARSTRQPTVADIQAAQRARQAAERDERPEAA